MASTRRCRAWPISRRPLSSTSIAVSRNTVSARAISSISSRWPGTGSGTRRLPPATASMLLLKADSRRNRSRWIYSQTINPEHTKLASTTPISTALLPRCTATTLSLAFSTSRPAPATRRSTASVSCRDKVALRASTCSPSSMIASSSARTCRMLSGPSISPRRSSSRAIRRCLSLGSNCWTSVARYSSERRSNSSSRSRSAGPAALAAVSRLSLIAESSICAVCWGCRPAMSSASRQVNSRRSSPSGESRRFRCQRAIFDCICTMAGVTSRKALACATSSCCKRSLFCSASRRRRPTRTSRSRRFWISPSMRGSMVASVSCARPRRLRSSNSALRRSASVAICADTSSYCARRVAASRAGAAVTTRSAPRDSSREARAVGIRLWEI